MDYIPPSASTDKILFHFQKADDFKKKGLWDLAIVEYKKILNFEPDNPKANFSIAVCLESKASEDKEPAYLKLAETTYHKIINKHPDNVDAHNALINISIKLGATEQLVRFYKEKLKKDPENSVLKDSLNKILMISLVSIPEPTGELKYKKSGCLKKLFVDILIPLLGIFIILLTIMTKEIKGVKTEPFRPLGILIVSIYLIFKIVGIVKAKKTAKW